MKDSEEAKSRAAWPVPAALAAIALLAGSIGIGWGLPSMARNRIYFSLGQDIPSVDREIVENSWKHFPEFGWIEKNKSPDNLQGEIKRSLFNPIRSYHPDEYVVLKTIANMNPSRLDFDPKFYAWPSFLIYLIAAALKLCSMLGLVHLTTDIKYYFQHPSDIARMYIVGRAIVAVFGAASVVLVYLVGSKLSGRRCGSIAAAALLASPAFVINTHYMTADAPMMFFALVTVLFCLEIARRPSRGVYLAAGAAAGLCAGMKYLGAAILFPLIYSHLVARLGAKKTENKWLLLAMICAGICFCIVNPFHILRIRKVLQILSWESEYIYQPGARLSWLLIPGVILMCGLGITAPIFGLAGLARFSVTKRLPDIIVASSFVIYLAMAHVSSPFLRHYLILVPFVIILAALLVVDVSSRFNSAGARNAALLLGAALLIGAGLPASLRLMSLFASENVRTIGGRWIAGNIERGAKIAVISEPWQFDCPPMDLQRYRIVVTGYDTKSIARERPEYFVGTSLELQTLYGFGKPGGDMKKFLDEILENESLATRLSIPGCEGQLFKRCPQDMRYVCPDILVYKFHWPERD